MSGLFANCSSLYSLPDIFLWDIGTRKYNEYLIYLSEDIKEYRPNFNYIRYMFYGCSKLAILPNISK